MVFNFNERTITILTNGKKNHIIKDEDLVDYLEKLIRDKAKDNSITKYENTTC